MEMTAQLAILANHKISVSCDDSRNLAEMGIAPGVREGVVASPSPRGVFKTFGKAPVNLGELLWLPSGSIVGVKGVKLTKMHRKPQIGKISQSKPYQKIT